MIPTHTPFTSLSTVEQTRLSQFILARGDVLAFAAAASFPYPAAVAWLAQPNVTQALDDFAKVQQQASFIYLDYARRACTDALLNTVASLAEPAAQPTVAPSVAPPQPETAANSAKPQPDKRISLLLRALSLLARFVAPNARTLQSKALQAQLAPQTASPEEHAAHAAQPAFDAYSANASPTSNAHHSENSPPCTATNLDFGPAASPPPDFAAAVGSQVNTTEILDQLALRDSLAKILFGPSQPNLPDAVAAAARPRPTTTSRKTPARKAARMLAAAARMTV